MKIGAVVFWGLFMLFFCTVFPILIYEQTKGDSVSLNFSPVLNLTYIVISLIIWLFLILYFFYNLIVTPFKNRKNVAVIQSKGIVRKAKITAYQLIKFLPKNNENYIEITLSFENLNHSMIEDQLAFLDTKPAEKRFVVGNNVDILLHPDPKANPHFILAKQNTKINTSGMMYRMLAVFLFVCFVVGLYAYYYLQTGWHISTFMHPIIFCGIMFSLYVLIYHFLIKNLIFGKSADKNLLYSGIKKFAEIINVSQTGLMVNDQPQIMFQVSFQDNKGATHIATYKKIVNLLDISALPKQGSIEIIYNENDPQNIIIPKLFS